MRSEDDDEVLGRLCVLALEVLGLLALAVLELLEGRLVLLTVGLVLVVGLLLVEGLVETVGLLELPLPPL